MASRICLGGMPNFNGPIPTCGITDSDFILLFIPLSLFQTAFRIDTFDCYNYNATSLSIQPRPRGKHHQVNPGILPGILAGAAGGTRKGFRPGEEPTIETLKALYVRFYKDHPEDFRGRSHSMSDIAVLRCDENTTAYYVDRFGFKEVPEFLEGLYKYYSTQRPVDISTSRKQTAAPLKSSTLTSMRAWKTAGSRRGAISCITRP